MANWPEVFRAMEDTAKRFWTTFERRESISNNWRPTYNRHAYEKINFVKVPAGTSYAFENGKRPEPGVIKPLDPIDDAPPTTVITHVSDHAGKLLVRGTTADNGTVMKVLVNGKQAKATRANFAEWEITLDRPRVSIEIEAHAEDAAGNIEKRGHVRMWKAGA